MQGAPDTLDMLVEVMVAADMAPEEGTDWLEKRLSENGLLVVNSFRKLPTSAECSSVRSFGMAFRDFHLVLGAWALG